MTKIIQNCRSNSIGSSHLNIISLINSSNSTMSWVHQTLRWHLSIISCFRRERRTVEEGWTDRVVIRVCKDKKFRISKLYSLQGVRVRGNYKRTILQVCSQLSSYRVACVVRALLTKEQFLIAQCFHPVKFYILSKFHY